jgi:hypothetical protein
MPITNPTPITPGACGIYWVTDLTISNPLFSAILRPSDGISVLLAPAKRIVVDTSKDAAGKAGWPCAATTATACGRSTSTPAA